MAERWYARLSPFMRHQFTERKSIILFADQPDFQQNNITLIEGEGTGGVTESARQRVVMPHTGSYWDTHHVLGHELVHVFQYDIAEKLAAAPGSGRSIGLNGLPLWLVEGMAEYLSLGRDDSNTSMWLRDAARRNDVPTIKQLTNDPRYFPYRYGQALWAYVGGRYGDQAVVDVYRSSLRYGFEGAIRRVLDVSTDQLSKDWAQAIKDAYLPQLGGRTAPDSTATMVIRQRSKRGSEYNVSPSISPDGRRVAFYSSRDLFGIELYVADVESGKVIKQLGSINSARHYDALSFIQTGGSWSPDGRSLAYVVYENGDQTVHIYDVDAGHETRKLKTPQLGTAADPAWSPDGRYIAFSGTVGGISDLYLYDLQNDTYEKLTTGRESELQPAWSPDGKRIAFVTDRGDGTNLDRLTFGPMRLAELDVASRNIRLLPIPAPGAKSVNPSYTPDGQSIVFVSDRTGFNDVYRMELATGALSQITHVQTGVLGVTSLSPAVSVARNTGRIVFSVFDRQGNDIERLDGDATRGTPVGNALAVASPGVAPDTSRVAVAQPVNPSPGGATNTTGTTQPQPAAPGGRLPPFTPRYTSTIEGYLADASTGLPATTADFQPREYSGALHLDYIAPPTFGVQTGGFYGTQFGGGVAFGFSDQLGNNNLVTILQAQGDVKDIGGEVMYTNLKHRWNYALLAGRIPYLYAYQTAPYIDQQAQSYAIQQGIYRLYFDEVGGILQYPLSISKRLELGVTGIRQSYGLDVYTYYLNSFGQVIGQDRSRPPVPPSRMYAQGQVAFVGDYSTFGFTSPIAGARYRLSYSPTVGQIQLNEAIADYRRYWFARPVTFAIRGLHYGRYGRDAQNDSISYPIYLGNPQFVRGYDYNSIDPSECFSSTTNTSTAQCPIFDRLLGSRIAVASAELRIPLLGVEGLGLIRTNFLPVEIAPFVDAGVAWNQGESPRFGRFVTGQEARVSTDRIPVVSAGISARINLFGYAVLETYYAYPFQRPDKKAHFGFQLAPGW
ncbi:surface antigen (D15) [Gemmatirosa kalamazoonensis]|uniref:Surface antigen (D15) n=1 Tax=Gemmatirosa kalamazoonensis TaxID=861299 RepID=W0RGT7_9BACT|nr:BamA/TamA family outer membrane protein [Gemmatirosa kalamazoonensis]AHG89642.1 surface antigen (D15) [Gemmatirosa kalamazoonensis]